ncbi:maleylpyruvate isomerase N-terminal domain-containing protein [Streptomyces sp. MST-110588]|uniref:maleylpyruvate isomerase N-terminal domain-containing protein n=1 Tax=Streptomyces sp. MST-110588 TaxID=2833628 RepID=UPI001F5C41D5|nr:maleylpyruvate isomerase N-terminal domain-containing protein [Streptomyces sp. MST-110588]UNO38464.1 maleylpyruvate isomerase N-terminal domain-containing protein [Streptomyces sp. MST-110588]
MKNARATGTAATTGTAAAAEPARTTTPDVRAAIAAERRELADLLDGLSPEQWDMPSLCAGWRVREVAAHMSLGFRYPFPKVALELVRARGGLHRMTDRCARKDAAALSTRELAAALRDNADHPGSRRSEATRPRWDTTWCTAWTSRSPWAWTAASRRPPAHPPGDRHPRSAKFFGAGLDGVELRAEDLDWSYGTGPPLTGAAQDLLLLAFGRKLPPGRLRGESAARFTAR